MKKKRSLSIILTLIMMCSLVWGTTLTAMASDTLECVDGSYLTHDDSSEVTVDAKTKGIYLKSGSSIINKLGTGYLSAGGDTVGQMPVAKISVAVRVERLVNGSWTSYTSWSAANYNSAYVSSSKTMYVPSGYYYRVCCTHHASSDVSYSSTDGLYI